MANKKTVRAGAPPAASATRQKSASSKVVAPESTVPVVPEKPETRWGWIALCLASLVLLGITAALAHRQVPAGWEVSGFRFINDWPNALRPLFLAITIAPEALLIGAIAVVVTFLLKLYRISWQLAAGVIGGFAVAFAGKHFIGRGRPLDLLPDVHARVHETGAGFPSGHTMVVTVIVLTFWPYLPRMWQWLALLCIPLMALSRLYLGVHLPLDVIGGFAAGAAVVAALRMAPAIIRRLCRFD